MSDLMRPQPFSTLLRRILVEHSSNQSIFGIPASLFYVPPASAPYATELYGHHLATPIGPAAGPHTQLSQNIISAWLCGGRFIELKTVQIMDELVIPRPCIDIADEGYNVEWSQELKLEQSLQEYVNAWAAIHVLRHLLGWHGAPMGTIFNMSIGYNLAGIQTERMTRFMDGLADASAPLAQIRAILRSDFPQFAEVEIPNRITNSVTLSTMHGCPPDEIERIARYLLEERGLHTVVKLNPTLLGKERVLGILHDSLGFTEIEIPDSVFEKDLTYARAVELIRSLEAVAAERGLTFGVKLSNTLAMHNHRRVLPGEEMYMSGRALHPVTMHLFAQLRREFGPSLRVSYSAGADAVNIAAILSCGALPVTACSDLLKPGGFARLGQWLASLADVQPAGPAGPAGLSGDTVAAAEKAAAASLTDPRYRKSAFPYGRPKVTSALDLWDCIVAPCVEACAVLQDVPEYAWLIAQGDYDRALEVILARNPLPGVTGYVCTHLCQAKCTRNDYEEPVAIRALKRIAAERGRAGYARPASDPSAPVGPVKTVAIIGSGPSGLAAAAFLAVNGVKATIYEARDVPGGMLRVVPPFRLPWEIIREDIDRIAALGVEILLNHPVHDTPETLLQAGYDAVYIASGFQRDAPLPIEGAQEPAALAAPVRGGVLPALHLLDRTRRGERPDLGGRAVIIGGGDTAMDAARTARRLTGGPVTILYRRTRREMPASPEEVEGALEEGVLLDELVAPLRVLRENGRVVAIECVRNALGQPGPDGRREPVAVPGSEFRIPTDTVIVAVGQLPEIAFLDGSGVMRHRGGGLTVDAATGSAGPEGVYAGGDVVIKPESIIAACADGRRAAEAICRHLGVSFAPPPARYPHLSAADILAAKAARARKEAQRRPIMLEPAARGEFGLIEATFTAAEARQEALRCLQCTAFCDKCVEVCPNRANLTFTMTPVSLSLPQLACQEGRLIETGRDQFLVAQDRQILHVADWCNECDDCQTFCVQHGLPYRDKPRLFLDEAGFAAEANNAFFIAPAASDEAVGRTIRRRESGQEASLTLDEGGSIYQDARVRLVLSPDFGLREGALLAPFEGNFSLRSAAEMLIILKGVRDTLPQLLV